MWPRLLAVPRGSMALILGYADLASSMGRPSPPSSSQAVSARGAAEVDDCPGGPCQRPAGNRRAVPGDETGREVRRCGDHSPGHGVRRQVGDSPSGGPGQRDALTPTVEPRWRPPHACWKHLTRPRATVVTGADLGGQMIEPGHARGTRTGLSPGVCRARERSARCRGPGCRVRADLRLLL